MYVFPPVMLFNPNTDSKTKKKKEPARLRFLSPARFFSLAGN